jgi:hypothetical protein
VFTGGTLALIITLIAVTRNVTAPIVVGLRPCGDQRGGLG